MVNKKIFILGCGGMARETYQIYKDNNLYRFVKGYIVNTGKNYPDDIDGIPVNKPDLLTKNSLLIAGIGSPLKKKWVEKLEAEGYTFDLIKHQSVKIGRNVEIGAGSIICANTVLTCDIKIGNHTIINVNSSVHHDCLIGSFVTIGPGSNIAGKIKINDGSFIGAGVTIIPGVKIGKSVYIGAGAVVDSNIPDNYLAYGSPVRLIKKLSEKDWKKLL